jgi:NAD(P)-dependent dehydrogenase (short-subunit alcohol dehydrogenase family)
LITGGSRGLGRSTALKLAEHGCDVIVTYLTNRAEADEVVDLIRKAGRVGAALPLNAADIKTFDSFAARLRGVLQQMFKRDRFNYLVNNAGTGMDASFAETTEEQFDQLMNIHLKGVFFLTQKLLPLIASVTALGRVGLPDDIGGAIAHLLAPESGWINAQRIEVSGGMSL